MKGLGHKGMNPIKTLGTKFVPVAANFLGLKGHIPSSISSAPAPAGALREIYHQNGNSINSQNMPTGLGKK